jgi:hypothetical protein
MKIYEEDCSPELAADKSLPYTAYLVEYVLDGQTKYDIVISGKRIEIFDWYWDHYRHDFVRFTQTDGRINPRLWNNPKDPSKTSKKK